MDFRFRARCALQSESAAPTASAFEECCMPRGAVDVAELVWNEINENVMPSGLYQAKIGSCKVVSLIYHFAFSFATL